jgi:hypothetical protein
MGFIDEGQYSNAVAARRTDWRAASSLGSTVGVYVS